ncbi:MAG: hypothetical protein J07HQW2_02771 [Haloquadratum walsbyi J07HQW2]|uniref:Uncharacterized protein n=1 Tax=Haloquadratum walsbyi J07HQW2 TaxID=1238425 RepID=U1PV70_9EURY|nr:MAG: hypothetical protein J07HQW2_02771 [Haloquadratum walsbyi J07HQW2]
MNSNTAVTTTVSNFLHAYGYSSDIYHMDFYHTMTDIISIHTHPTEGYIDIQ